MNTFNEQNLLRLNVSKCELVLFSKLLTVTFQICEVDGFVLPTDTGRKFLIQVGSVWTPCR